MWAIGHCKNLITRLSKRMSFRISVRQNLFRGDFQLREFGTEGPADMKLQSVAKRQQHCRLAAARRRNFDESVNQFAEHNYNKCI